MTRLVFTIKRAITRLLGAPSESDIRVHELFDSLDQGPRPVPRKVLRRQKT